MSFFLLGAACATTDTTRPNILLLFPDQWRYDWDGLHDPKLPLKLPNIRALAASGVRFENAIVPAPVCAPSRAALASGREYDEAGVAANFLNDYNTSIPTFYSLLRAEGYHTMTAGKDDLDKATQLGTRDGLGGNWTGDYHQSALGFSAGSRAEGKSDVINLCGNKENSSTLATCPWHERYGHWLAQHEVMLANGSTLSGWRAHVYCMAGAAHSANSAADGWRGASARPQAPPCTRAMLPDDLYEDNWVAAEAIALLRARPRRRPFFLQVNFAGPHPPFLVTPAQFAAVANRTFPPAVDAGGVSRVAGGEQHCAPTGEPSSGHASRCDYAAEMENLDRLFGLVLGELAADEGVTANTLTVFASDHGEMLGDHGDTGKTFPWQASASVPLIISGPGVRVGVEARPVATLDLAATFLD
jgi:arylsulfatase